MLPRPTLVFFAATLLAPAHAAPPPALTEPQLAPVTLPRFALLDTVHRGDERFGRPARSDQLDAQRGGTDTVDNTMQLDGSVHGNVANNVVTGANSIDAGSFANMSGIPTVIQNTGANVLIQNATIINLQFK